MGLRIRIPGPGSPRSTPRSTFETLIFEYNKTLIQGVKLQSGSGFANMLSLDRETIQKVHKESHLRSAHAPEQKGGDHTSRLGHWYALR